MGGQRPRHRVFCQSASSAALRPVSELMERLGCPGGQSSPRSGNGLSRHRAFAERAETAPRIPVRIPVPRSPTGRRSTLARLAVSAVGVSSAATGAFGVAAAADPSVTQPAQPIKRDAVHANAASTELITVPEPQPAVFTGPAVALAAPTVLAEDAHRTDAMQIAALARSVDMTRAAELAQASAASVPAPAAQDALLALPGSAVRVAALAAAMSKRGTPYVWGAAGPSAFDCSGLVQWAYRQVGIPLPRVAEAQSLVGTPVSRDQLRPGDLVFFYTPVSHVGIYVGDNKVLNASEPGQPVKISSMAYTPFHNARRIERPAMIQ
ncbi:MAG: C40 family peptidase [Pseudonocardia sp.]|nr:C40 family peptidase [Pseudonocardia sp.]